MLKKIRRLLFLAALAYAVFCIYLYFMQRSILYAPTPEARLTSAERVDVPSGADTLRIWARPREGAGAVIYFGGNGEDVAYSFQDFAGAFPGRAVYLVNYRGYGGSTGTPSEQALFQDALAVYDRVSTQHSDIAVIGSSLGSGVAVYLASARKVDRLALVTPFDSLTNVAQEKMPLFPMAILLKDKFDSLSRVPRVSAKTLILIAGNDEMISRARSDALTAKFPPGQASTEVIPRATHNDIGGHPRYLEALGAFLSN